LKRKGNGKRHPQQAVKMAQGGPGRLRPQNTWHSALQGW